MQYILTQEEYDNLIPKEQLSVLRNGLLNAIDDAKTEVYNKAIDDVSKLIEEHEEEVYVGVINDILMLKK